MKRWVTAAARRITGTMLPDGLLLASVLLLPALPVFDPVRPYIGRVLAVSLLALLLLAWRLRQGRLAMAGVLVVGAAGLPWMPPAAAFAGALLVPINLALLGIMPTRGPAAWAGVLLDRAILVQIAGVLGLAVYVATGGPVTVPEGAAMAVPVGYAAAVLVLALSALRTGEPLRRGLFWATVGAAALQLGPPGWLAVAWPAPWPAVAALAVLVLAAVEKAHRLAYYDRLTGLPGRRALDERLARTRGRYVLAMVDVDHFKKVNDRHGHAVGDQVLRLVAARLRETRGARAYRYGGEEFTLVFRAGSVKEVKEELDAVRRRVADHPFTLRGPNRPEKKPKRRLSLAGPREVLDVTVSLGAAERERREPAESVLERADQALYRAKKRGRNRVVA